MKMVCQISTHGNRSPKEVTWTTGVKIEAGLLNLHFLRPTPFCRDGYRNEMDELLIKMGWEASGMMGMTWKDGLSPEEFTDAFSFIEAYKKVYEREIEDSFADVSLTLRDFLDRVEKEEEKIKQEYIGIVSTEKVIEMLTAKGFELIEDN